MGLGDRRQQTHTVAHDEDLQDMRSAHRRGPPRGVAVGRDVFAAVLGRERTGEPALGQPGVQAPPEAAGATGVGFASRPGGVS